MPRPRGDAVLALRERRYRRVWMAVFVSNLGVWFQITARALLVYRVTGSTGALGTIYLVSYGPQLFLAPYAGALADRYDRRHVLVGGTVLLALANVGVGGLAQTGTATLANLAVLSFVSGCLLTVTQSASNALLPSLVSAEALPSAVGLQAMTNSVTRVFGPLLAGALIPVAGIAWLFYLNALSLVPVVVVWLRTEAPSRTSRETGALRAIVEGWQFTSRTRPIAVPVALLAVLAGVGLVYQPLGIAYATKVLAHGSHPRGATYFILLQACIGAGSILGILGSGRVSRLRPAATLVATGVGFSGALLALGLTGRPAVALLLAVVLGACQFANSNLVLTLAQMHSPDAMRGRVMSLTMVAFVGIFPFASYAQGMLAQLTSERTTFVVCGAICLVASVGVRRWRADIRFPAAAEAESASPAGVVLPRPAVAGPVRAADEVTA